MQIDLWSHTETHPLDEEILKSGAKINNQILEQGEDIYKQKMEGQISAVAMLVPGIQEVETKAEISEKGEVLNLHILVRPSVTVVQDDDGKIGAFSNQENKYNPEEREAIIEKLLYVVTNMYGLEGTQIKVEFEGG